MNDAKIEKIFNKCFNFTGKFLPEYETHHRCILAKSISNSVIEAIVQHDGVDVDEECKVFNNPNYVELECNRLLGLLDEVLGGAVPSKVLDKKLEIMSGDYRTTFDSNIELETFEHGYPPHRNMLINTYHYVSNRLYINDAQTKQEALL